MVKISKQQLKFDREHIWHPYSSMTNPTQVYPVASAQGVYIELDTGEQLIDGMSSWWSTIHGYNHPALNQAAKTQIDKMAHVMFGGLTHQPAIELCQKLVELSPANLDKVFLADSGSIAIEVALKMALQYWQALGQSTKQKFITIRNGYHGDTFAAMSVCDPETGMHELFQGILPQQYFAPAPETTFDQPWQAQDIAPLRTLLEQHQQQIAALILEPIVQGAGGMRFYSPQYLTEARALCDEFNILLIVDEIATGFGRTGKMFASEHANIEPDILCLGKGLTGGYLSLAATLTTEKIAYTISQGGAGCFMHGPTFMGNPLACAVANASLDLLKQMDWKTAVAQIEQGLRQDLMHLSELTAVANVRVLGAIGVIEMQQAIDVPQVQQLCIAEGIWLRPFGKLIYVMPAYIMSQTELNILCRGISQAVSQYANSLDNCS